MSKYNSEFKNMSGDKQKAVQTNELLKEIQILKKKNALLEAIVESIPVAVFVKDAKDDFRVKLWNTAAEKSFELPRDVILNKSAHDLWPKDQSDLYLAVDKKVANEGIIVDIPEEPSMSKTRGTIYFHTKKMPLKIHGPESTEYLLCICDDITEQRSTAMALEQEQLMSLRNAKLASLGELAAGMAHEINNPLTIISGCIHSLTKFEHDKDGQIERFNMIQKSSERIAKIVTGLRKFSRSTNDHDYQTQSLQGIINEALTLVNSKAKLNNTPITFKSDADSLILCDEIEIEQVLINLLNNAIDAVRDLDEKWIKIHLFEEKNSIVIHIRDSGKGIPENVQEKLFQPFFTTKPIGEGTGLGLSISKGILDDHKASIRCVGSEPSTCFEIRFPKATS